MPERQVPTLLLISRIGSAAYEVHGRKHCSTTNYCEREGDGSMCRQARGSVTAKSSCSVLDLHEGAQWTHRYLCDS